MATRQLDQKSVQAFHTCCSACFLHEIHLKSTHFKIPGSLWKKDSGACDC